MVKDGIKKGNIIDHVSIKFSDGNDMYDYLLSNNDLYSDDVNLYVFRYSELGSIAVYDIYEDEAKELFKKVGNMMSIGEHF